MTRERAGTREWALGQKPIRTPVLELTEAPGGELHVRLRLERPRWQRLMGAPAEFERTFVLDAYGRQVYEACDGATRISTMIKAFARRQGISDHEAEVAVTTFLKTLIRKGLVIVAVRRPA